MQQIKIVKRPSKNYKRRALRRLKVDFFCDRDKVPNLCQTIVYRTLGCHQDRHKHGKVGWRVVFFDDNFPERDHANEFFIDGWANTDTNIKGRIEELLSNPKVDVVYFAASHDWPYTPESKGCGGWIMTDK